MYSLNKYIAHRVLSLILTERRRVTLACSEQDEDDRPRVKISLFHSTGGSDFSGAFLSFFIQREKDLKIFFFLFNVHRWLFLYLLNFYSYNNYFFCFI